MRRKEISKKLGIAVMAFLIAAPSVMPMRCMAAQAQPIQAQEEGTGVPDKDTGEDVLTVTIETYEHNYVTEEGGVYKETAFAYPSVAGDSDAAQAINKFYRSLFNKWKKATEKNLKDAKEVFGLREDGLCYADEVSCEITSQDENYISFLQLGYDYQLGAHGMPYRYSYIFDVKTGKKVSASKILGISKKELNDKVRKLYLKKYDKNSEMFYEGRDGLKEALGKIDFNQNKYYIKNGKIRFYVDPYAVAPYAAGFVEVAVKL